MQIRVAEKNKTSSPKIPYKVHILTLKWKKECLKPMLNGTFVVINQLIKLV
jgi:hypothetical protein